MQYKIWNKRPDLGFFINSAIWMMGRYILMKWSNELWVNSIDANSEAIKEKVVKWNKAFLKTDGNWLLSNLKYV